MRSPRPVSPYEVVPGVSTLTALPALAGIPLTSAASPRS